MGLLDPITKALGTSSPDVNNVQYGNTGVDYTNQQQKAQTQIGQGTGGLMQAQQMYAAAAQGQGPSVAELQLQGGQEDAARQAAMLAASARGTGGQLMAANAAQAQNAMGQQTANFQAAQLRAQEIMNARAGLMQTAQTAQGLGQAYQLGSQGQNIAEHQAQMNAALGTQSAQSQADISNAQQNNALVQKAIGASASSAGTAAVAGG